VANGARVALESAVITHGLPYPTNLESARRMQQAVQESGAVPYIVAILRGEPCIGIADTELETLAQCPAPAKIAQPKLGIAPAQPSKGGKTV
ncbi:MAG: pseudouridine-5'-phosphate glycosidase, partial [Fimbriimonadales bacterium]